MNIRIWQNDIRYRISIEEVERLASGQKLSVQLPSSSEAALTFELQPSLDKRDAGTGLQLEGFDCITRIIMSATGLEQLKSEPMSREGIVATVASANGQVVTFGVEVDLHDPLRKKKKH